MDRSLDLIAEANKRFDLMASSKDEMVCYCRTVGTDIHSNYPSLFTILCNPRTWSVPQSLSHKKITSRPKSARGPFAFKEVPCSSLAVFYVEQVALNRHELHVKESRRPLYHRQFSETRGMSSPYAPESALRWLF